MNLVFKYLLAWGTVVACVGKLSAAELPPQDVAMLNQLIAKSSAIREALKTSFIEGKYTSATGEQNQEYHSRLQEVRQLLNAKAEKVSKFGNNVQMADIAFQIRTQGPIYQVDLLDSLSKKSNGKEGPAATRMGSDGTAYYSIDMDDLAGTISPDRVLPNFAHPFSFADGIGELAFPSQHDQELFSVSALIESCMKGGLPPSIEHRLERRPDGLCFTLLDKSIEGQLPTYSEYLFSLQGDGMRMRRGPTADFKSIGEDSFVKEVLIKWDKFGAGVMPATGKIIVRQFGMIPNGNEASVLQEGYPLIKKAISCSKYHLSTESYSLEAISPLKGVIDTTLPDGARIYDEITRSHFVIGDPSKIIKDKLQRKKASQ